MWRPQHNVGQTAMQWRWLARGRHFVRAAAGVSLHATESERAPHDGPVFTAALSVVQYPQSQSAAVQPAALGSSMQHQGSEPSPSAAHAVVHFSQGLYEASTLEAQSL